MSYFYLRHKRVETSRVGEVSKQVWIAPYRAETLAEAIDQACEAFASSVKLAAERPDRYAFELLFHDQTVSKYSEIRHIYEQAIAEQRT